MHNAFQLQFDQTFLDALENFHGGTPHNPYFLDGNGREHRIGWFVSLIDEESSLPGPFQDAFYYSENDTRIDDRSLSAIFGDEVCPYHFGQRIIPLGALYSDQNLPLSLRLYTLDSLPDDSICFDTSTTPFSIVYCNAEAAVHQALKWEDDPTGEYVFDYDFLVPVANSFVEFTGKLYGTSIDA